MSKVLAFVGSPRKEGVVARLVRAAGKGVFTHGPRVKYYDLNDPAFRGCQGCFYCRANEGCSVQDYLQPAYEELKDAPGIIFGSPIYFYSITGQAKMWIDRMFPMVVGDDFAPRYPGKRAVTIFAQGESDPAAFQEAIDTVHGFLKGFGWRVTGTLVATNTTDDGYVLPEALLEEAGALGRKMWD